MLMGVAVCCAAPAAGTRRTSDRCGSGRRSSPGCSSLRSRASTLCTRGSARPTAGSAGSRGAPSRSCSCAVRRSRTGNDRRVVMRGGGDRGRVPRRVVRRRTAGLVADRRDVRGPSRRRAVRATRVRRRGRGAARADRGGRRVRPGRITRAWRFVGTIGAAGAGAALLLSQTRGAWVGAVVAARVARRAAPRVSCGGGGARSHSPRPR